jgi:endonuclease-3
MTRRESMRARRERTAEIVARLRPIYPDNRIALNFTNPFELLVATVLAAQCTDERVNAATPALFRRFPTPRDLAGAAIEEVEELVRTTGFYRNKAKAIRALAQVLAAEHGGEVPADMDALRELPGVGRKTANVVLGNAFGRNEGVVVDTHVHRLSRRLGLTEHDDPEKIEQDLMALVPREDWTTFAHLLIDHGRKVCKARKPECAVCVLADICPSAEV